MRFKVLMIDVDGVVIVHPDPDGWSANLARDLGLSRDRLQSAFFAPHWQDVVLGRADLYTRLAPVLSEIAPGVSPAALVDYWFANDAHLDHSLLDQLGPVRASGIRLHLATVQEHRRARYIWNTIGLKHRFDALHYSAELGSAKPDERFYLRVEEKTGFRPDEILFIDDKQANVDAARRRGWTAHVWDGTRRLGDLLAGDP